MQEHQGQQAADLGFAREQPGQRATQPDRLVGQFVVAAVAFVEDQVDDGEHGVKALTEQVGGRDPERDPGRLNLAFGPDQPLGRRRLRHQDRPGDLAGGQPAQGPESERHLGLDRERGGFLGEVEVAEQADEGGQDAAPFLPEDPLERGYQ